MAIFLPFLGYNNGKKDPNTCFPIYVDVTWPIKAFPFGFVESKAGLPCLAFFGQKRAIFGPFLPFLGVANEQKGPNTCFPMYVDVIWPIKAFPFDLVESKAGLPCLAFFGQKRALFRQTPAKTGGPESKKKGSSPGLIYVTCL